MTTMTILSFCHSQTRQLTKTSGSLYPSHISMLLTVANSSPTILDLDPGVWTARTRRLWFVSGGSDAANVTEQLDTVNPMCLFSWTVAEQPGHEMGTVAWKKNSTYVVLSHISIWYVLSDISWSTYMKTGQSYSILPYFTFAIFNRTRLHGVSPIGSAPFPKREHWTFGIRGSSVSRTVAFPVTQPIASKYWNYFIVTDK